MTKSSSNSSSSSSNAMTKSNRQVKNKKSKKKFIQHSQDTASLISENDGNIQAEQEESNLVVTNQQDINSQPSSPINQQDINSQPSSPNQQDIDSQPFPQYEPPPGWEKMESNDFSTFDFKNVHKEENELWLFKIPPNISKSDLKGLTLKLPIGLSRVPTKVATIQKVSHKKINSESVEYDVYEMPNDDDISQENETAKEFIQELRAPHEINFRLMKELEIFLPCQEAQGLLLSQKRPTRYFNICRPVNPPDPSSNIDSILAKKSEPIPHPPETFIPRYTSSFPDYSKKHMIEAREYRKKFMNRMIKEWNFPKWQQQIKEHERTVERAFKGYQKKCKIVVNKSKNKFAKEVEEKRQLMEEEKIKGKKRKFSNDITEEEEDDDTSTTLSSESEIKKTKIFADLKRQEESDSDSEILEEVAREEAAFIKLAKNQIYQRELAAKEAQEAEKRAADTWTSSLVNYPIYKPPETWWSKTYNKILEETEQTKLRPKLAKRKYTLEERLEYYKKHGREPPLYSVPRTRGKIIEINYGGIEGNLEIPKPRKKKVLLPPPPGVTGHLRPCVELTDS